MTSKTQSNIGRVTLAQNISLVYIWKFIQTCRFVIAFDTKLKQNPDFNEMKGLKENFVSVISFETTNHLSETMERTEAERNTS